MPDKSDRYMKTVVAFVNGSGGRIVFGIDDKTSKVVGMDSDNIFKTMDAITNAISDACEPRIMPEGTCVRISGTTRPVEGYMLKELILRGQNRYYDSEPCNGMGVTDAEIETLCKSMK